MFSISTNSWALQEAKPISDSHHPEAHQEPVAKKVPTSFAAVATVGQDTGKEVAVSA